jgi:hypothetical protein
MWDLEMMLAHVIPPSAGLAPPANPDQAPIPIKASVTHVIYFAGIPSVLLDMPGNRSLRSGFEPGLSSGLSQEIKGGDSHEFSA